jgi:hypothetical protein
MSLLPGPPSFCPHCGGTVGGKHGDDSPVLLGFHTVTWADGFGVSRVAQHRGALYVEIRWRGETRLLRVMKTKIEVQTPNVEKR